MASYPPPKPAGLPAPILPPLTSSQPSASLPARRVGGSTNQVVDQTLIQYGVGAANTQQDAAEEAKTASGVPQTGAGHRATDLATLMEQVDRLQQQVLQQQTAFAEQQAQHQHAINTLLSERPVNAVSTFRTPPSTRVSHLYAPADRAPARVLFPAAPLEPLQISEPSTQVRIKDVLDMVAKFVTPFNGVTTLDRGRTVMSFVENVEMVMGNVLPADSPHRMMTVQMCLRDAALQWLDNHLREIAEEAVKVGRSISTRPVSWDTEVRDPFILAFTGADMVEMWLAQLSALRLGGEKTKTPVELNIQFDALARHVYPNRTSNNDDLMLAQMYRDIVAASDESLWKNIIRNQTPTSLKEWKLALAKQWNAEEQIKAWSATQKPAAGSHRGGHSSWRGRGVHGRYHGQAEEKPATASAASMESTDGAGPEGQQAGEIDDTDEQLSGVGSFRGGRGGGRGGRGGARPPFSPDKQKLYDEQRCFNCKQLGHIAKDCRQEAQKKQGKA